MTLRQTPRTQGFPDFLAAWFGSPRERALRGVRSSDRDPEDMRDELADVYVGFERLVETLCDAAQFGPSDNLQLNYERGQTWWKERFSRLHPFVTAYLRPDAADDVYGVKLVGRKVDAFEALVVAEDLETWLAADDGEMVSRIVRAREALTLYGEHLRLLSTVRR